LTSYPFDPWQESLIMYVTPAPQKMQFSISGPFYSTARAAVGGFGCRVAGVRGPERAGNGARH